LTILVKNCRGLVSRGADGLCDPYIWLSWGESQRQRSRLVKKTTNPEFNSDFQFRTTGDVGKLTIEVWDWDRIGTDELIGQCYVAVNDLKPHPETNSLSLELVKTRADKTSSRRSKGTNFTFTATKLLAQANAASIEEIFDERHMQLLQHCLSQKENIQKEKEITEKIATLKRCEIQTLCTERIIHSNEDIQILWFFSFLLIIGIWNLIFRNFFFSILSTDLSSFFTLNEFPENVLP